MYILYSLRLQLCLASRANMPAAGSDLVILLTPTYFHFKHVARLPPAKAPEMPMRRHLPWAKRG